MALLPSMENHTVPKTPKNFSHLNEAIPDLAAAAAVRKADAEKADQEKCAKALAKKMMAVAKRGVR